MTREEWRASRAKARYILHQAKRRSVGHYTSALVFIVHQFGPLIKESLLQRTEEAYETHAESFVRYRHSRPETTLTWKTVYRYRWARNDT